MSHSNERCHRAEFSGFQDVYKRQDMMEPLIVGLVRMENGELDAQLLFAEGLEPVINEVPVFRDFAARCV